MTRVGFSVFFWGAKSSHRRDKCFFGAPYFEEKKVGSLPYLDNEFLEVTHQNKAGS
jgi:hypothetical protein